MASLGGGILVIAVLSLFWPPSTVLGVTAPALFVGNASRAALMRDRVNWRIVRVFAISAVPAALGASLVAAALPASALRILVAAFLLVFVGHELRAGPPLPVAPGGHGLALLAGAVSGLVSGLTGGAGFVCAPFLHRMGLDPAALVATSATCMAIVHAAKGAGFGLANVLTADMLPAAAALAFGIIAGNALGARVLERLPRAGFRSILLAAITLAALQLLASTLIG